MELLGSRARGPFTILCTCFKKEASKARTKVLDAPVSAFKETLRLLSDLLIGATDKRLCVDFKTHFSISNGFCK